MSKLNEFYAKTWLHAVLASFFGLLAGLFFISGVLVLFEIPKTADGRHSAALGFPMVIMSILFLTLALAGVLNIRVRSQPIIRIVDQGLEINLFGSSTLEEGSVVPILSRVSPLIFLTQGSRQQSVWVPWSTFRGVEISGSPMAKTLTLFAVVYPSAIAEKDQQPPIGGRLSFPDEFADSLEEVCQTITDFAEGFEYERQRRGSRT